MTLLGVRPPLSMGKVRVRKNFWKKTDLTGLWDWGLDDQKEAWELIVEYNSTFTMQDMDLDKTSLVKHSIKLMDNTLFKECYWCIPPSMYEM